MWFHVTVVGWNLEHLLQVDTYNKLGEVCGDFIKYSNKCLCLVYIIQVVIEVEASYLGIYS